MKTYLYILICILLGVGTLSSQNNFQQGKVKVIHCTSFGISKPLRELGDSTAAVKDFNKIKMKIADDLDGRTPPPTVFTEADGEQYGTDPSIIQTTMGNRSASVPGINWNGEIGNFYPPDPTGAVGPNHYLQCVNSTPIKVFDKTNGNQIGSVVNVGSLWSPAVTNGGDPIVLYDKYADRWFISQIGTGGSTNIYIAVSTSPDPTGTYYTYTFPSTQYPDYQKFSIWADGYYMTANQNIDNVACFERDSILAGAPSARMISATFTTGTTGSFFIPLPADADGALPPYGTPLPFFALRDNNWGGGGNDGINIWQMQVNWVPTTPTAVISANPVFVQLVNFNSTSPSLGLEIPQPGTTQKLDALTEFLNFRAQWRQWSSYRTVVLTFNVKLTTSRSVHWAELRQDTLTGAWSKHQAGTFAPDASYRWCGSIAMDDNGSIALCYNKSSATAGDYPSLAYTGRDSSDALNTMTFPEVIAYQGTGSQTQTNRWGDYSQTCIDPSDGLTFWHTGEHGISSNPNCATRIYSFKLPAAVGIAEYDKPAAVVNAFLSNKQINVIATNLPSDDELVVDLFDIVGRRIIGKKVKPASNSFETAFDVSSLARGTYLVRVGKINSTFQRVKKIIVQ